MTSLLLTQLDELVDELDCSKKSKNCFSLFCSVRLVGKQRLVILIKSKNSLMFNIVFDLDGESVYL